MNYKSILRNCNKNKKIMECYISEDKFEIVLDNYYYFGVKSKNSHNYKPEDFVGHKIKEFFKYKKLELVIIVVGDKQFIFYNVIKITKRNIFWSRIKNNLSTLSLKNQIKFYKNNLELIYNRDPVDCGLGFYSEYLLKKRLYKKCDKFVLKDINFSISSGFVDAKTINTVILVNYLDRNLFSILFDNNDEYNFFIRLDKEEYDLPGHDIDITPIKQNIIDYYNIIFNHYNISNIGKKIYYIIYYSTRRVYKCFPTYHDMDIYLKND